MESSGNSQHWVFFDLGWTLEDETAAQEDRARQLVRIAASLGRRVTATDFASAATQAGTERRGNILNGALEILGFSVDDARRIRGQLVWNKGRLRLYPDAQSSLDALAPHVRLGIIANQSAGAPERLRRYGLLEYCDVVLTSAEVGLAKPDPLLFARAQELAGALPASIWMIGDRLDNDIAPARARGWRTIRVLQGHHRHALATDDTEQPDFTVGMVSEAVRIVLDTLEAV